MSKKLVVAFVLLALTASACTKTSGLAGGNAKPSDIYAAGPTLSDVKSLLAGDDNWWPAPPSFGVRPLDAAYTPLDVKFSVTQRFVHIGTAERFTVMYIAFQTVSAATARMTSTQSANGTSASGPKAGDQVLYYAQQQPGGAALFEFATIIRVAQFVISADWSRAEPDVTLTLMGKIATRLVSKLKDVLAGKVRPSPVPTTDAVLLPPPGTDVTLVGSARIPVEATAQLLDSSSPKELARSFHNLGVNDFLFGDYALDNDSHMEVRAAVFTFSSQTDASSWLDAVVGKGNLDQNGVASGFSSLTGEYYAVFASGQHAGLLICRSTAPSESASRSCELPMARLIASWKSSLSA